MDSGCIFYLKCTFSDGSGSVEGVIEYSEEKPISFDFSETAASPTKPLRAPLEELLQKTFDVESSSESVDIVTVQPDHVLDSWSDGMSAFLLSGWPSV